MILPVELPPDTIFQLDIDTLYFTQTDTIIQSIVVEYCTLPIHLLSTSTGDLD